MDKHAVIGAGFSGLGVMAAFRRAGIPFDAFEAEPDLGGNWRHGVYETVHIISSRRTTEYAEFPMPADWPDFPSAAQMLAYLRSYADAFELRPHISFDTRLERLARAEGGGFELTLLRGGAREVRRYRGVVVCNGHHWDARLPRYEGNFAGELIHSKEYKRPAQLAGKRVLVIGGGNSACDIAVESARFAKSAHISLRRGYWFLPKTMLGIPTVEIMKPWMPVAVQRLLLKGLLRIVVGRYQSYGLPAPDHELFEHHPTVNSELLYFLRHGRVTAHPDVNAFHGREVEFADGRREEVDLVVCATGYNVSFPFLADDLLRWKKGMPELIGPASPDHAGLYFFGLGQPRYGAGPLISAGAELLCDLVRAQEEVQTPVGLLLRELGGRPLETWVQDPMALLRQIRLARFLARRLKSLEPLLLAKRRWLPAMEARHA
ncbi:MAG: flavin-containing monooxygenase [Myxococcales bacterium]